MSSVTFQGTDACPDAEKLGDASLIYRYRIQFNEVTQLNSVAVTGAAFNGPDNVLRVLDESMNVLATMDTTGGNTFRTTILNLHGVEGTVFFVDEFDTSTTWRFRQSIVINGAPTLGNLGQGVLLGSGASNNLIGGAGAGNVIAGNYGDGVDISDAGTNDNTVQGNHIGMDINGTQALGQGGFGMSIGNGAFSNVIGGPNASGSTLDAGNLISGNGADGIVLFGSDTTDNSLQGNYIGTDITGSAARPNAGVGVWIGEGASDTLIGGTEAGAGNLISGNAVHGISINHPQTTGTHMEGNYIGTDKSGTNPLPNGAGGIYVSATQTWIGGSDPGAGNLISGNSGTGVDLEEGASNNFVQGNLIGTDATGTLPVANSYSGVYISTDGANNAIGGPGEGNLIAFNLGAGIATASNAGLSNSFLSNSIFSNGWLGIDLGADGVTLNDVRDRDTGPNNLQNFPVLSRPKIVDGVLRVAGTLSSNPDATYHLEFFSVPACDDSGYGEGKTYLGSGEVTLGPSGSSDFSFSLSPNLLPGELVTATATDAAGNTSEFSACSEPLK